MPAVQRSESLRSRIEPAEEAGSTSAQANSLPPILPVASGSGGKPAERSVSFNRDVHVKRIGRETPRVTSALVGDGEGRLIATPVRKERITSRSKEDLAQEAALILEQVGNLKCIARDNKVPSLPGKFSTLPARRNKKRPELPLDVRRRSEEIGVTTEDLVEIPKAKKKALERSASDASARKVKNPIVKLFSPKLERKGKPVARSYSDAGTSTSNRPQRKRSGSESEESSHVSAIRAKKQLSPIIEASPQVDAPQPFNFSKTSEAKKSKKESRDEQNEAKKETLVPEITVTSPSKSPKTPKKGNNGGKTKTPTKEEENSAQEEKEGTKKDTDEVDSTMLHSSRYDQQIGEESTIHKMIHRLSNDRSPPPHLPRTLVTPSPGFGHNNNMPFSYTRPNESSPTSPPGGVIYAQVQMDKKKAQRSHSDSDEGLGLERKDSSRENSPAEKDYRRADYTYNSDLHRNNEINSFKSRYDEEKKNATTHFGEFANSRGEYVSRTTESKRMHDLNEIDRGLFGKPEKYTSTVFVDTSDRGRADGMDSRRKDNGEFNVRSQLHDRGFSNKTSELSARRDLLESRIKSRLLADEMFAAKSNKVEHEIIDKPIVPSPVIPNRVASPKRYVDTYITETRTNSNGDKYIFEKELHQDNGKVYGYEKKITNKIPGETYVEQKPRDGYTVETRTNKYGDKYIVETRTHESYADDFKPFLSDRSRTSPEERFQTARNLGSPYKPPGYVLDDNVGRRSEFKENVSPILTPKKFSDHKLSKSDDFLDRDAGLIRDPYSSKPKKSFETMRGISKSSQRLDQIGENARVRALRSEYTTRSHENLSTVDYVNARDLRRSVLESPPLETRKIASPPVGQHVVDHLRERPNDDYDTDISQLTNSQLGSKYYKETRTTQRYMGKHPLQDEYDSSPPRMRPDRGYNSSRYDSDTTARDSVRRETRYLHQEESTRTLRKERKTDDEAKKMVRRSRNHLDYFDDSDARDSLRRGVKVGKERQGGSGLETFDESPPVSPRAFHESKTRHTRHHEARGHSERRHRESRLSDPDRKDRLADSGIENDYRRDSQEADRREPLESEDEGFVTMRFIRHERRHTDRNMDLTPSEKRRYDKYVSANGGTKSVTSKPPSGLGDNKKYEKKVTKKSGKSGTMSKVKQLFSKKEKKAKEESQKSSKKNNRISNSGALTDDEVTMRYREYRGDQLRSAKSARDLDHEINQEDYSRRRRLSTPSGSPSPPRPARLSQSTGTLTREEEPFRETKNTLTRENQPQEAESKGWFKSLSRKNKSNIKQVDKKPRIPESEILTTGTEDEGSSVPERTSVQKNLRFFGDTDQESVSSNRERRNKRADDHTNNLRRDATNSRSHSGSGLVVPPRKPPRLAESALSSGESTTGDSSQQSQNSQRSQRSVVYLHAATVGEIPGPNERRRAASREELNRPLHPQTRTVSRSVSVLAPWKPRHYREPFEINYEQQQQKPVPTMRRRHRSRETLSRRSKDARRSRDNLSKTGTMSRSTLKSKDKQKVDRTVSTESLANKSRSGSSRPELNRSTSVPRDPNKSAGWFKLKSKKSRA
ncbi:uncharacterized protein LOC124178930 isoform X1 [Neodiprion fabricii]|uniref:uncharacterized protein LOC124178930 isoform X1 n=1 Tax=Neodiprion fabricii TaxID=2872261 RepID=UPI001ED96051|nr:uncharacterized protein LOC124178930 isoform X1 [Neodiprion fabricii]